jgi:hypothetical protein
VSAARRPYPGLPGLRAALARAGWTQAGLARRLGYTPGYLSAVARGHARCADWVPERICALLGTNVFTLYGLTKGDPAGPPGP